MINTEIGNDWDDFIEVESKKEYFKKLMDFLEKEYNNYVVFPPEQDIFNAIKAVSMSNIKVVILGQDPYHEYGQAHGFAFSVKKGVTTPRSLSNIYKELEMEFGKKPEDIINWCSQGVLLLNTVLTVREGIAASHSNIGWETFTDNIIIELNKIDRPIVFMLWGNNARNKEKLLTNPKHLILETTHPSPFSAKKGFLGCNHFKIANGFLQHNEISPIQWV